MSIQNQIVRIAADKQSMWGTGDATQTEWSTYVPIIGGEATSYTVERASSVFDGEITVDGTEVTFRPTFEGLPMNAPFQMSLTYDLKADDGTVTSVDKTFIGRNTEDGPAFFLDGDRYDGALTFDAVSVADMLQAPVTYNNTLDVEFGYDAAPALADTIDALEAAQRDAQAKINAAATEFATSSDKLALTAEAFGQDIWAGFNETVADVAQAASDAFGLAEYAPRSAVAWLTNEQYRDAITARIVNREINAKELQPELEAANALRDLTSAIADQVTSDIEAEALPAPVLAIIADLMARLDLTAPDSLTYGEIAEYAEFATELATDYQIKAVQFLTEFINLDILIITVESGDPTAAITGFLNEQLTTIGDALQDLADDAGSTATSARGDLAVTRSEMNAKGFDGNATGIDDLGAALGEAAGDLADSVAAQAEFDAVSLVLAGAEVTAGNKLDVDMELDVSAHAQAGLVVEMSLDGGSVDSTLDYAVTSEASYDAATDTFTIAPTATNATTGDSVAFSTISPNASFYIGVAYDAGVTFDLDFAAEAKAFNQELFNTNGEVGFTETVEISGMFDILSIDTANLSDLKLVPEIPGLLSQPVEFNDANQIEVDLGEGWAGEVIEKLAFGVPVIETEGKAAALDTGFYQDPETDAGAALEGLLSDLLASGLDFSEKLKDIMRDNGVTDPSFDDIDFADLAEAIFDAIGEELDDGEWIPIIEMKGAADSALFHIDQMDDLSGLNLGEIGQFGFFTASGEGNNFAEVTIDVDMLAAAIAGQIAGVGPQAGVEANPVSKAWSLDDEIGEDTTSEILALVRDSIDVDFGFDLIDVDVTAGARFDQDFALRVDDMTFAVTFEDGTSQSFDASEGSELVFANASALQDTNNNGQIDYTLSLTPKAEFFNDTEVALKLGVTLDLIKAELEMAASLPLSKIPDVSLSDIELFDADYKLGPIFRGSVEADILTADIFEDRFAFNAGSAEVAGALTLDLAPVGLVLEGDVFDNYLEGLGGADFIRGKEGSDALIGGAGADELRGGRGIDFLDGEDGADLLDGGRGNDFIVGGNGRDTALGGDGWDEIEGGNGHDVLAGNTGRDIIKGQKGADAIFGGKGADILAGNKGWDAISGGRGNDTIDSGRGNDVLTGGLHSDTFTFKIGDGQDVITDYEAGIDTVALAVSLADVALTQAGDDVMIAYGDTDTIRVEDTMIEEIALVSSLI